MGRARRDLRRLERQRHHGHRRVLDRRQLGRGTRRHVGEQPRRRRRGGREHHRVGLDELGVGGRPDDEREAGVRPPQLAHGRRAAYLDPLGERLGQARQTARDTGEHRHVRDGHLGVEQTPALGRRHQLRHGRPRGQLPGVAGVDAAEQRLDQPVDDLVPEPARDQVADRDVLVERQPGLLGRHPGQPRVGQDPATAQLVEVERAPPSASAAAAGARRGSTRSSA